LKILLQGFLYKCYYPQTNATTPTAQSIHQVALRSAAERIMKLEVASKVSLMIDWAVASVGKQNLSRSKDNYSASKGKISLQIVEGYLVKEAQSV